MSPQRSDIEQALDELISQEGGMRFQGLAVVLGKQRWPELIAHQRKKDFGLDAYASASETPEGGRQGTRRLNHAKPKEDLYRRGDCQGALS